MNGRTVFAIDFRDTYDLEKPLDWSYRLQSVQAFQIPASWALHDKIKARFLEKEPMERWLLHSSRGAPSPFDPHRINVSL